jgi:hypothetical protein
MRNEHTPSVREHLIVALELQNSEISNPRPERRGEEDENKASKHISTRYHHNRVESWCSCYSLSCFAVNPASRICVKRRWTSFVRPLVCPTFARALSYLRLESDPPPPAISTCLASALSASHLRLPGSSILQTSDFSHLALQRCLCFACNGTGCPFCISFSAAPDTHSCPCSGHSFCLTSRSAS